MKNSNEKRTALRVISKGCFLSDVEEGKQTWLEKVGNPPAFVRGRAFAVPIVIGKDNEARLCILSGRIMKKGNPANTMLVNSLKDFFSGEEIKDRQRVLGLDDHNTGRIPGFEAAPTPETPGTALEEALRHITFPNQGVGKDFAELYINDYHYDVVDAVPNGREFGEWTEEMKETTSASDVLSAMKENDLLEAYSHEPARLLYLEALKERAEKEINLKLETFEPDQFGKIRSGFEKKIGTVPLVLKEKNMRPLDLEGEHPSICSISMYQPDGEGIVLERTTTSEGRTSIRAYSFGENRETDYLKLDEKTFSSLVEKMREASDVRIETNVDRGGFHNPIEEMDFEAGISTRETLVDPKSDAGKDIISDIKNLFEKNHIHTALDAFKASSPAREKAMEKPHTRNR